MNSDNIYVCNGLPELFLFRSISSSWWTFIEDLEENNSIEGDRFLVRRYVSMYRGRCVITDYITRRENYESNYGKWTHHTVAYYEDCESPYSYEYDRYHNRDYYLSNNSLISNDSLPVGSSRITA